MALSTLIHLIASVTVTQAEYAFRRIPLNPDHDGFASSYRLEVERVRDRRIVFHLSSPIVDAATMDQNRRSLAFTDQKRILIWRPDRPLRRYPIPELPDGCGEGIYEKGGLMWSPDSRSLLVWIPGTQGSMSLGHGELFVLETATGRTRYIDSVAKPRWVTARIVEYWKFHHDEREMSYYSVLRRDVLNPMSKAMFQRWEFPEWGAQSIAPNNPISRVENVDRIQDT